MQRSASLKYVKEWERYNDLKCLTLHTMQPWIINLHDSVPNLDKFSFNLTTIRLVPDSSSSTILRRIRQGAFYVRVWLQENKDFTH